MNLGLKGKRALITGGAGGLGAAIARTLAAEGANIAIGDISNAGPADVLVTELRARGVSATAISADVRIESDIQALFVALDQQWGGLDILINNAGIDGVRALSWEAATADWMNVLDINLKGAFLCAREALRRMVPAKKGVILNVTSVHEEIAWTGYSAYASSKAALSMMAKTLAQEAAPYGVRVLSIAPGAIRTPINQSVWQDSRGSADLIDKIPLGRIGDADEVARMAAVLVSDVAAYMTATTVFVDGGMTDYPAFAHGG